MNTTKTGRWWTVAGIVIVIYSFFPLLWMISLAFKPPSDIVSGKPSFLPSSITFDNFAQIFSQPLFTRALINSIGNTGGFFGPYIMGGLKSATADYRVGLYVLALVLIVGVVSMALVRGDKPAAQQAGSAHR